MMKLFAFFIFYLPIALVLGIFVSLWARSIPLGIIAAGYFLCAALEQFLNEVES
jgi:ABC-type uncharacterized transport system permease subunit